MRPAAPRSPSWVLPGAKYDIDYANRRFKGIDFWAGSYISASARTWASHGSYTNSGIAADGILNLWKDGIYRPSGTAAQSYMPRITDYGLWAEGDSGNRRNYVLQPRDLSNASWMKSNATGTRNQVGVTGVANSASSLTATASNGTATQTLSYTAKLVTHSIFIKRLVGTGTIEISGDTAGAGYTDVTGQVNSSEFTRIRLTSATLTNPTIGIRLGTSGDSIAVDVVQNEPGDQMTSPLVNTSSVLIEGPGMFALNTNGSLFNDGQRLMADLDVGPFAVMIQYSGNFSTSAGHGLIISGGGSNGINLQGGIGSATVSGGIGGNSVSTANSDVSGLHTINKVLFRVDGSGGAICLNGGTVAKSAAVVPRSTSSGTTHVGIGSNGSNTVPFNGYIPRMTVWKGQLPTDGQMVEFTG